MSYRSVSWSFEFTHGVDLVWDVITNTDRMNRSIGLPPVTYKTAPNDGGGTKRTGKFRVFGLDLHWIENPFEWVQGEYFSVERNYLSGPVKNMRFYWRLTPTLGGCRVDQRVEFEPKNFATLPLVVIQIHGSVKRGFIKFYRHLESSLKKRARSETSSSVTSVFAPRSEDVFIPDKNTVKRIQERLVEAQVPEKYQVLFTELIFNSQAPDLIRIRPFSAAKKWNSDREEVLSAFLGATKAGIFDLSWDLICPGCRGAKGRTSSLTTLKSEAHCDQCDITYDAQFDSSVELSFTPSASIRKVEAVEFCAGSPQNTRHFLLQQRIGPGESKEFSLPLVPGVYRFRSLQSRRRYSFRAETKGEPKVFKMEFDSEVPQPADSVVSTGIVNFEAKNSTEFEIVLTLERGEFYDDACTAAFATSFQDFRDLFASEVLQAGEEIVVSSISILFTDLKDSTYLYRCIGDARAFALVNEHLKALGACVRKNHGAVVKTIGDAIMASFIKPEDALEAAFDIQEEMSKSAIVPELDERLSVRIGIHTGPCFVINRNDKLDYFGTTVNLAARAQGECEGKLTLVTGKMIDDPGVKDLLRKRKKTAEQVVRKIKGFEGELELYLIR